MRRAVAAALAAASAVLALLGALPAHAAAGRISEITTSDGKLRVVFSATGLASGSALDPGSVQVTANGETLKATAERVSAGTVQRVAVLVIDTSGSMRGVGIAGAKTAATTFVNSVPADVRVGLITFSDRPAVRVAPTTDRNALRRAIAGLTATGETALYDAVALGLRTLGSTGSRSTLVLSDGADTRSRANLSQLLTEVRRTRIPVDVVAFRTADATPVLQQIAQAAKGRSLPAQQVSALGEAFAQAARALTNEIVVLADVPQSMIGQQVTIRVAATAGAEAVSDEAVATLPTAAVSSENAAPRLVDPDPGPIGKSALVFALLSLFIGVAALLIVGLGAMRRDHETGRVRRRLSLYTLTGRVAEEKQETTALGDSAVARSAVEFAGRVVQRRDLEQSLARRLENANVPLRPAEWMLIHIGVTLSLAILLLLLSGGALLPTLVGLLFGFVAPLVYLNVKAARRTTAFMAQLPDTLQLLAGSLQAGYSLPQALDTVVREGTQPIAGEFNRALVDSRLGVPVEDALESIADRMDSRDFAWVVMAVRIQREVGGNLAEVLTTTANTMRDRERVRRQVRVLSAEGRLSGWILGGLPPIFGLYLLLVRPEYVKPLFTDPLGVAMLAVMGVLFSIGVLWMRKVVKVEV